jgi:hypothetical protein
MSMPATRQLLRCHAAAAAAPALLTPRGGVVLAIGG